MRVTLYHLNRVPMAVEAEQGEHSAAGAGRNGRSGTGAGGALRGTDVAVADTPDLVLSQVAAGMVGGVPRQQFMDNINAAGQQFGNRALVRWVRSRREAGRGTALHSLPGEVAGEAVPGAASPAHGPLQLMSKKKKKQAGVPGEKEQAQAVAGAEPGTRLPEAQVKQAALPESGLSQAKPGATAEPVVKKKKKSRVQVALNTLRDEGVTAFREYIEAEIGEAELLRTLVERITRAENLEAVQAEALRVVEGRLRLHDPAAGSEPSHAVTPRQGEVMERPVKARFKAKLSKRERDLLEACMMGNAGRVRGLLRHGNVDINVGSEFGTFLCLAAYEGRAAVVRELLSRPGIDVNLATPREVTPLYFAAQEGHVEIVELLLGVRAINVNLQNMRGVTPLSVAAYEGREEVVKLLLAVKDVSVNVRGPDGATALFYAAQKGYPGIVELLLAVPGIDVNATGPDSATPLHIATQNGEVKLVKLLLAAPDIDVDASIDDGVTSLYIAAHFNFPEIVDMLVRRGADVNLATSSGVTSLCTAAKNGYKMVVRALLQAHGIRVNQTTEDGITPLNIASQGGHKEIVRLLLCKGAEPNMTSDRGIAPLHVTSLYGHMAIAQILLHAGADLDAEVEGQGEGETIKTYTPSSLAELGGHRGVLSVLAAYRRRSRQSSEDEQEWLTPPTSPTVAQPGETISGSTLIPGSPEAAALLGTTTMLPASVTESQFPAVTDRRPGETAEPSSTTQTQDALRKQVLMKLEQDNLEPLEGIRLLEDVNASPDLDSLCILYNRLAHIERRKERARRRGGRREKLSMAISAPAAGPPLAPVFSLGERTGLGADTVEGEIKRHLEQKYQRFVSQAVNDMEFGRGKRTEGYPGLWHASAGIAGVGSCSVFYYIDGEGQQINIVGIGHHVGRAAYRLDYATEELGGAGHILRIT